MAGLALTGGAAIAGAQEQSTQEEWDTDSGVVTEQEREDRTGMETDTQGQYETQSETGTTDPYESQSQSETGTTDPYESQSQSETGTTDPYESQSQSQTETTDPYETQTTDPYGTQSETETQAQTGQEGMTNPDLTQLSSAELEGKTIISSTGEEIGTIEKVGYSAEHQDRVAAVNVGGFLGAGQKVVAVPLSDLQMGQDPNLTSTMDRQTIEQQQEIDPASLSEDPASTDPMQQQ